VAVKQPFSSEETEFRKESTILRALGPKNHPHLIKSLATYKIGKKYHLIFPYANANLRKYWEDHPAPSFTRDTVLWSLQQMSGIVKGLQLIHDFRVNIPLSVPSASTIDSRLGEGKGLGYLKVQKGEQWFGRHGDIKPENILWFAKDQYSPFRYPMGVLQIADFGMGRFHGRDSHSGVDPEISAPAYEPPECKMHIPVSRAYDIWSLGCLYLEFITWVLRGSPAIDAFADFRGRNTDTGINDDSFFTIANEDGVLKANVREGVLAWSEQLHADKNCSKLIHDLLDLTMSELLVIETEKRSKANWLCIRFQKLLHRAESDPEYLLKPDPRRLNQLALGRDITHSDSGGERVVEKTRATKAKNDREIELNDMKKFADSFKLTTPLPSVPTSWHHEVPAGLERIAEDEGQEGCSTDDRSHNTGAVRKEPSSLAHSFVDSGYASGTVAKSEQVQDRDDDQPQHFTQNGDASDPENVASGDTGTVYDAPSIPASEKETYISELADDLISKVCYDQPQGTGQTNKEPDKRLMERICTILPELLRALAFSVGQNAQAQEYRDISVYVHKYRT
jgi:serine/threonine protein kinase